LLGALFVALYPLCFFAAVARTGVVIGTLVAIGSAPVIAGLLAWLLRGEVPGPRWIAATLLAISGCSLLVLAQGDVRLDLIGMLLALGAGLSYALYTLLSKDLMATLPPDAVMALLFGLGALLLLPLLLFSDIRWITQPSGLWVVLHLGLVATALSYLLFGRGLKLIAPARAVTLSLAEPLTAGVLGVVLLGESLTPGAVLGILLLLAALLWLALDQNR
jgi:DME family drug/metabolite transporter